MKSSAVAIGLASWPLGSPLTSAAATPSLNPARRRTFTALVGTVAAANGPHPDGAYLRAAAGGFDAWYAGAPPETRDLVERTLDGVESAGRGGFSRMTPGGRLALLRGWRYSRRSDRRGLAYDAVVLASSPFGPSPYGDATPRDL